MMLLDFLYPPKCKICNTRIKKGVICPFCVEKLDYCMSVSERTINVEQEQIGIRVLFPYENDTVKALLFALKRKANRELFILISTLFQKTLKNDKEQITVVNVPRSRENIKKYGYDHIKIPCKILCRKNKKLTYSEVLKRCKEGSEQKNLDAFQRKENVKDNFVAVKKDIHRNILLVDDVVTTASTACECIKELRKIYKDSNISCIFLAETGSHFPGE